MTATTTSERTRSMLTRTGFGKLSRDNGQRFKVTYFDGTGLPRNWGWTDSRSEADSWVRQIEGNPVFRSARVVDRERVREVAR